MWESVLSTIITALFVGIASLLNERLNSDKLSKIQTEAGVKAYETKAAEQTAQRAVEANAARSSIRDATNDALIERLLSTDAEYERRTADRPKQDS